MELTQAEWDRATDIVAQEVGFKVEANKRPRPSLFTILRVLLILATRRGRQAASRGIACEASPGSKPNPELQLVALWCYAVQTKAENLKLAKAATLALVAFTVAWIGYARN
jgi:hypothetical protein